MRLYKVLISRSAELDIIDIEAYIRETFFDLVAAERIAKQIQLKISSLVIFPERSRLDDNYYFVKVKNYRIIYRVKGKTVYIVRVLHSRQSIEKNLV